MNRASRFGSPNSSGLLSEPRDARYVLADLHVHLRGCLRPIDILEHLASSEIFHWDWYEGEYEAVFGHRSPAKDLVERYRGGDKSVLPAFAELVIFSESEAGSFERFQARGNIKWITTDYAPDALAAQELAFAEMATAMFASQGVAHVELTTAPLPEVLEAFGSDRSPITRQVVGSIDRRDPWASWEVVQAAALGPHGRALVAVDSSGMEEGLPPKLLAGVYREIREFNDLHPERALAIRLHVGESFGDKTLESAIRWVHEAAELGAHRLGHAIALGVDPAMYGIHDRTESVAERLDQIGYDLNHFDGLTAIGVRLDRAELAAESSRLESMAEDSRLTTHYDEARLREVRLRQGFAMECVRRTGAVIEVCPTSNRRIAGIADPAHHPVHRFLEAGLRVVIATDNPGTFDITLEQELDWVCEQTGGGEDLRHELIKSAWEARAETLSGRIAN